MALERYQVAKGIHGSKSEAGDTVLSKPGDPILLDPTSAKRLGSSVRPWPKDEEWPLTAANDGEDKKTLPKATLKTTLATPVSKKKPGDTEDPHEVKERSTERPEG